MKKPLFAVLALALVIGVGIFIYTQYGTRERAEIEYVDKKQVGVEQVVREVEVPRKPSANEIRGAIRNYILQETAKTRSFDIYDREARKKRRLALVRVHQRVGKTGDYYYACADFRDFDTGEALDLDLDVEDKNGVLSVVDVRIHKLNGKERYTYDENNNRIPVSD